MSKSTVSSSNKIIINSASYTPAESLSPSIGSRSMQDEKELCDDVSFFFFDLEKWAVDVRISSDQMTLKNLIKLGTIYLPRLCMRCMRKNNMMKKEKSNHQ